MVALNKSPLPRQSKAIYQLLREEEFLTAQDIAQKLSILPNAVYRSARSLIEVGLIEKLDTYPTKFRVRPPKEAIESYLLFSKNAFMENLFPERENKIDSKTSGKFVISFIKTRSELLDMTNDDLKTVQNSVDNIVSGLELPSETVLSLKKALDRGVKLRSLVQNLSELNFNILSNLQKMGLEMRYYPLLEARIIIFDSQIVYLTSYNPQKKEEAIGVRFAYPPIAKQMSDLFEKRWEISKPINRT